MKGLELPINMIVVVAIAVLVLVVIAAFFAGRLGAGTGEIELNAAFNTGCNTLRSIYNCVASQISAVRVPGYAPPGQTPDSLGWSFSDICARKGFAAQACAVACGCPSSTVGGPPSLP